MSESSVFSTADKRLALRRGVRALGPSYIATGTWGLVTGVAMIKSGLDLPLALAMTLLVYAGSAQLTSLPLIAAGAPIWVILLAGFMVNLRFVIFSAALHPYFRHLSFWRRLGLGYLTVDMCFVVFMARYGERPERGSSEQLWFHMGSSAAGWVTWQSSSLIGIALGTAVPSAWSLDFAALLALLAILMPLLKAGRPVLVAVFVTVWVAWLTQTLPLRLGLVIALVVGIAAGMLAERWLERTKPVVAVNGKEAS
jgi:predicted branched-subunit amino acid permease